MAITYTAEDVLRVAVRVEKQAAAFYQRVAEAMPERAEVMLGLARIEDKHAGLFDALCGGLSEEEKSKDALGLRRESLDKAAEL